MQHTGTAQLRVRKTGSMITAANAAPSGLHADQVNIFVFTEGVEQSNGVAATAHTGNA